MIGNVGNGPRATFAFPRFQRRSVRGLFETVVRHAKGSKGWRLGDPEPDGDQYLSKFLHTRPSRYDRRFPYLRDLTSSYRVAMVTGTSNCIPIMPEPKLASFSDLSPAEDDFLGDVIAGLSVSPKSLPCKYFYDAHGSKLFDRICELPEYYPTRTETALMREKAGEMAAVIGPGVQVMEYGCGSIEKVRVLLDALEEPASYIAVDISREHPRGGGKIGA